MGSSGAPPPFSFGGLNPPPQFLKFVELVFDTTTMAQSLRHPESAAQIAGRILVAWHSGQSVEFENQVECYNGFQYQSCSLDTCESERMEALEGALECLRSFPQARVRAAIQVLEHLARPVPGLSCRVLR